MPLIAVRSWLSLLLTCVLCGVCASAAASPPRLLCIVEGIGLVPWSERFLATLRTSLLRLYPAIELDVEAFAAINEHSDADEVRALMSNRYAGRHYDIVLVLTAMHLRSLVALRDQQWPQATLILPSIDTAQQASLKDVPRMTGLLPADAHAATLELLFRLLPDTQHVAWISWQRGGNATHPKLTLPHNQRADVIDLSGLTVDQLQQRVQALPPHTAVYFAPAGAPAGRVRTARDLLKELSELANAPVFVNASTGLDTGAIGGAVTSPESSARDIATQIDRLLAGVPAAQIGFELPSPPQVQLDWRAMRRWNIPSRRVPSNSGVLYRPPGLWEAYPTQVIAGLAVFAMLSGLIAALLIERRRRLLAELQARRQLNHLAQLSRGAALGALSAALAHEINQPLAAILANAETAELLLDQTDASAKTALRESIAAICEDNHRASAVLERLRAWIANAPGDLQPCTLNPLIDGVARMLATELQLRHTELQLSLAPGLPQVWADRVQIQQVVLNLVVNALDALQTMHPPQCRIVVVSTAARDDGQIEATVSDNGCGLPSNERDHLFEPFVSTKPNGLGVGLAISHSIIERHQGRLWVETPPEAGTRFHFTLKAVSAAAEGGV